MGREESKPGDLPVINHKIFVFGGKAGNTMKNLSIFLCVLLGFQLIDAQTDTIQLSEANLSDSHLLRFTETQRKTVLSDSVLQRNGASLSGLLNFNSLVYIKENGAGMVASPSFRGTTASQTAVIWNGININSRFLGQTDFNTVNPLGFDHLVIKPGGGSIAYGSGAIGGSVHLNNQMPFNKNTENEVLFQYGSFQNYGLNIRSRYSNEKISLNLILGRNGSDNDYDIEKLDRKNLNGQFYNQSLSVTAGYKFDSKNLLKFYGNLYDGERHFSLISPNSFKTKYHDYNTRSMIEWNGTYGNFISNLKLVHLGEEYRYYPSLEAVNYEFGKVETQWVKYDLGWRMKNAYLNLILDYNNAQAKGSAIVFAKRQTGSASLLWKQKLTSKLRYEASISQEFSEDYKAPFLYSFGIKWNATKNYEMRFNSSKNFRMPTFNDLYLPGNENLKVKPETSLQAEWGNHIQLADFHLDVLGYYNAVKDFILWVPNGSLWYPENVGEVRIYGLESQLNYTQKFGQHRLEINASYGYTVSRNEESKKQLIYVPFHQSTASVGYSWKRISSYYQFRYNGKVFTDSNNQNELKDYSVSNLGLELGLGKNRNYKIGAQVLNVWDEAYENVLNRAMPGRHYNLYIHLKFK